MWGEHLMRQASWKVVIGVLPTMGLSYITLGRYREAEPLLRKGIAMIQNTTDSLLPPAAGILLLTQCLYLAEVLARQGASGEAEEYFQKALKGVKESGAPPRAHAEVVLRASFVVTLLFEDRLGVESAWPFDQLIMSLYHAPGIVDTEVLRRQALGKIKRGYVEDGEKLLRLILLEEYHYRGDKAVVFSIPDSHVDSMLRSLEMLSSVLEGSTDDEGKLELARLLRAEIEKYRAIEEALRVALLAETRDEAAQIMIQSRSDGSNSSWTEDIVGGGRPGTAQRRRRVVRRGGKREQEGVVM